jgi:hypothetical protein
MSDNNQLAYQYAWDWFRHHAVQRYSSFYYFLLIMGALAFGYTSAGCTKDIKTLIGGLGIIITFAFLMIEKRNNMLVNDGRAALECVEKNITPLKKVNIRAIDKIKRAAPAWKLISHIFWFRVVIISLMILSIVATSYPLDFKLSECLWFVFVILVMFAIVLAFPFWENSHDLPIKPTKL